MTFSARNADERINQVIYFEAQVADVLLFIGHSFFALLFAMSEAMKRDNRRLKASDQRLIFSAEA